MALCIGVTGHRLNKLAPESRDAIAASLRRTFALVDAASEHLPATCGRARAEIELLSGLAEGADSIAVRSAPTHWSLIAVLPMPREDYVRDFLAPGTTSSAELDEFRALLDRASRVVELPSLEGGHAATGRGREWQYAALGAYLVDHVDVLVAVWDGQPASGPGGTATVVAETVAHRRPVLWIDPHRPDGAVLIEAFLGGDLQQPQVRPFDAAGAVAMLLRAVPGRSAPAA